MKKLIIISSIISSIFCFAQQERNRKFELSGGLEYRITPFNFKDTYDGFYTSSRLANYNRDLQLSGLSLNISLDWFFLKNTSFGLVQSFRYDQLYYQSKFDDPHTSVQKPVYGLILDTEIQLKQYLSLKNGDKLFVNLGYNIMNQNTDYSTTHNYGEDGSYITQDWFRFNAYKIGIGYQYKNLQIGAGTYIVDNPSAFVEFGTSTMGIPYLKINYILGKF
jgi:hypothetical protein